MSEKVKSQHVGRRALLYVRQSSTYQVHHNLESQKLQYAIEQRLRTLGWREVEVIDEDLGRSAAGTMTRSGFVTSTIAGGTAGKGATWGINCQRAGRLRKSGKPTGKRSRSTDSRGGVVGVQQVCRVGQCAANVDVVFGK